MAVNVEAEFGSMLSKGFTIQNLYDQKGLPADLQQAVYEKLRFTGYRDTGASTSARYDETGFSSSGGLAKHSFEDDLLPAKKGAKLTQLVELDCGCIPGRDSMNHHLTHCRGTNLGGVMKHGLPLEPSPWGPTDLSLGGMNEQATMPLLTRLVEQLYRAYNRPILEALVPTRLRGPNEALSVVMATIRYLPAMAGEFAVHALPPMVHSTTELHRTSMSHIGLSSSIALEMLGTTAGDEHMMNQMIQMTNGFQNAKTYGAAIALASAWRVSTQNPSAPNVAGASPMWSIDDVHNSMALTWACLQQSGANVFKSLTTRLEDTLVKQGMIDEGAAHVMVVPPDVVACLTVENSTATRFDVAGPEGPAMLRQNTVSVMNPSPVYGERTYVINNFLLPPETEVNPMRHFEEIMEHVTMIDSTPASVQFNAVTLGRGIYCSRGWRKLTFEDAIENLPIWNDRGDVTPWKPEYRMPQVPEKSAFGFFPYVRNAEGTFRAPGNIGEALDSADEGGKLAASALRKFHDGFNFDIAKNRAKIITEKIFGNNGPPAADAGKVVEVSADENWYLNLPFTKSTMLALVKAGIRPPIGIIIARSKRYITSDVWRMVEGKVALTLDREGMAGIFPGPDMKRFVIAEKYQGTVVPWPRNIVYGRNVVVVSPSYYPHNRGNGEDLTPYNAVKTNGQPVVYNPMRWEYAGDAFYIPIPIWWTNIPQNLNILGTIRGTPLEDVYASQGDDMAANGYPTAYTMDMIYGLRAKLMTGIRPVEGYLGSEGTTHPPAMVSRMEAFYMCNPEGRLEYFVPGEGYWHHWAYPKDATSRFGRVIGEPADVNPVSIGAGY
jgi:hypothetical protein